MKKETKYRTTRQLKEIHLALFYTQVLGAYGTDGHHRLVLISQNAQEEGYRLIRGGNELETPPHVVEVQQEQRQ